MSSVERRFQRLSSGIELLNLLFVVDAIESQEQLSPEKLHAFQMALLRTSVYSQPKMAEQAYQDLLEFLGDVAPAEGTPQVVTSELELEGELSMDLLRFLRAVEAQKKAAQAGSGILYSPLSCPEPALASKQLIDELLARLQLLSV